MLELASLRVGDELLRASSDHPLLADSRRTATADDGTMLELDRVRPLLPGAPVRVLATDSDGHVIATESSVGAGRLIVFGTSCLLEDRWLTYPANAAFVARLGGTIHPVPPASIRSAAPGEHLPPQVVEVAAGWLPSERVPTERSELVRIAGHLNRSLPVAVHDALIDFADQPHPSGALLLRGMPIGDLPPTPATPTSPTTKDLTSELVLLTVARRLGQPVGYLPEHGGTLIQNICPTPNAIDRQVSTSSAVDLMFHTEAAFHPHRPRYLLLLCLRGDPDGIARTTIASIRELLDDLPLRTRRVLFEPRFRTAADESYVGGRSTRLGHPAAVLEGDWETPHLVFDADLMVGVDAKADEALQTLVTLVAGRHSGAVLRPGDLLVVDNSIAVHGRSPFRARFDGTDRWLQRVFVVGDLLPSAGDRTDRVITTRFAR